MSGAKTPRPTLTVEDLDRYLDAPAGGEAARPRSLAAPDVAPWADAAAVLVAFDPVHLRPAGGSTDEATRQAALDRLLPRCEQVEAGPQRGLWTLAYPERRDALRRLGGRAPMRRALAASSGRPDSPVQRMFERLVDGAPLELASLSRDDLAGLVTALDWVSGILDGVPDAAAVRSALADADRLAPMRRLAGRTFVGRERELEQLRQYVFAGGPGRPPLFVFGPGGMGKSTLLARFILEDLEPRKVPFVYVDIDRPTIRPDRPTTVLIDVVTQLQAQLGIPFGAVDALLKELTYSVARREMGRQLESSAPRAQSYSWQTLFVLPQLLQRAPSPPAAQVVFFVDTFEEAQFLGPDVSWQMVDFLRALAGSHPSFRVVASGRALPPEFVASALPELGPAAPPGDAALERVPLPQRPIDLGFLDVEPAIRLLEEELAERGRPPLARADLDTVVGLVGRSPMCLKLAARLLSDEGLDELRQGGVEFLAKLKAEKVQALLYGRILHHVHDEEVRKVAYPGLIVRRIDPEVIRDVLAAPCGLELSGERGPHQIFSALAKEASLVELDQADGSLRHRPDVRRVMLADLSEHVEPAVVERIDREAVAFYEQRPGPVARAEELYHRLRLREPAAVLDARWSADAAPWLRGAGEELPAEQRLWLAEKLGVTLDESVRRTASQEAWEAQTARVADRYLQSGEPQRALEVLRERPERSPRSALYLLEAEALRFLGELDEAIAVARAGVDAASAAGAIDLVVELLLKIATVEQARGALDRAEAALGEAEGVAVHGHNDVLRLQLEVARLRVQRQHRPSERDARTSLRREVLARIGDATLHKLRDHPVLLREIAAELGKDDARIAAAAIETLGVEVASDEQASALHDALKTLTLEHAADAESHPVLKKLEEKLVDVGADPELMRELVTRELTSTDTKSLGLLLSNAGAKTKVLGDFRRYFRAGVESVLAPSLKVKI